LAAIADELAGSKRRVMQLEEEKKEQNREVMRLQQELLNQLNVRLFRRVL
jgi:wobble nucleotide-excising tRNase